MRFCWLGGCVDCRATAGPAAGAVTARGRAARSCSIRADTRVGGAGAAAAAAEWRAAALVATAGGAKAAVCVVVDVRGSGRAEGGLSGRTECESCLLRSSDDACGTDGATVAARSCGGCRRLQGRASPVVTYATAAVLLPALRPDAAALVRLLPMPSDAAAAPEASRCCMCCTCCRACAPSPSCPNIPSS